MEKKFFDIYTIGVLSLNTEQDYECEECWETYYSVDEAVSTAIDLAKELANEEDTYVVSVFGGEYQDVDGNTFGEPENIYMISSKDKEVTISERLNCGYTNGEVNAYINNGNAEFK